MTTVGLVSLDLDTRRIEQTLRIIAKHATAAADELEALREAEEEAT